MLKDYDLTLLMLLFMRMTGCVMFNPIFARKNVPVLLRVGLTLALTYFTYSAVPPQTVEISSTFVMIIVLAKELLIGLMIGFIIQLFMSTIIMAGEIIDMQMGLSMSKIYDPGSNVSMPISASFYNALFVIVLFITNSHLTLVRIFSTLGYVVPYGEATISTESFKYLFGLLSTVLVYAVKMTLPVMAAEIVTEFSVGIMMKAVPQINVFVINIQLKVFLGFIIMMFIISPMAVFFENLVTYMFDSINVIFDYATNTT
ncbi:MAG: flagellar biosynthetic protein FliR [Clostridiales bacterium]|nr:flagellar biosynthetic protein FliR [Clostridiales bacterium]